MISLAGLLLFAGIANFALVTITVLHEPKSSHVSRESGRCSLGCSMLHCCQCWYGLMVVERDYRGGKFPARNFQAL